MKKLYFLNEEEKERILKLHESATRKQYISEDMDDSENMDNRMCEGCGKSDMYEYSDLDEADAGNVASNAAAGAALGTYIAPGMGTVAGAVIGAAYGLIAGAGGSYSGVKKIFDACKASGLGKTTMNGGVLDGISKQIKTAIDGWGTDEDAIKSALSKISTIPDLCAVEKRYAENYPGYTLLDDLDGDIDSDSEWNEYVYQPLLAAKRKSEELGKKSGSSTGTATSKGSIADKYWDVLFNQLQPLGAKMSNQRTFIYWGMWVIYKDMSKNGGYPITYGNPIKMSFKFSNGTYAGQPLQNITLIAKGSTTPITIQSLAKMKEAQIVAAGSGSVSATPSAGKVSSKGSKPSGPSPVLTSDIKQIQNIVGVAQTGVFDTATKAAVKTKLGIK